MFEIFVEAAVWMFGVGFFVGRALSGKLKTDAEKMGKNFKQMSEDGSLERITKQQDEWLEQERWKRYHKTGYFY